MFNNLVHRLKKFVTNLSDRRAFVLSFGLGFFIRLIPELLSYPSPIGFDTVYYAARIKSGVFWSSSTAVFSMWLFEGILISANRILQMNPFFLLKIVAPLLYALNVCGIYHFSRKGLNWNVKTALVAAFFFSFQLASLRLSWDLYRNLLGLAILLFTLPLIKGIEKTKNFVLLLALSLLLVLSHTLVASVLFAVVLSTFISHWLKRERLRSLKLLLAVLPASALLFTSLFVFPFTPYTPENIINSRDAVHQSPAGVFFLVNYLSVSDTFQKYPTYLDLALHVFSLFSVLYLWWLPLVTVGFFRDATIDAWTLLLLFGSFNALITPFCAVDLWSRWMFMLVYPFTFYAINGAMKLSKLGNKSAISNFTYLKWMKVTKRTVNRIFPATIILGSLFLALPPLYDRFGVFSIPTTISYMPSTMVYNNVPLRDVRPTVEVLEWLNSQMNDESVVLVHYAFVWWTDLYLDKRHEVIYFVKDYERALGIALEHGFNPIYTIWWNESLLTWRNQTIGWYGLSVPKCFKYVFSSDRISVLRYSTD